MRLTCPNCGAAYDAPANLIPRDGRHVQCSDCHTRWFVTGGERPTLSEEQVLARLESRRPKLRAVPEPEPEPEPVAEHFIWESPEPGTAGDDDPAPGPADPHIERAEPAGRSVPSRPALRPGTAPSKPGAFDPAGLSAAPSVPQPLPVPDTPEPPPTHPATPRSSAGPTAAPDRPAPRRTSPRLDLTGEHVGEGGARPSRSRFGRGLAVALACFAVALLAYVYADRLAVWAPPLAPAVGAYVDFVDTLRDAVATRVPADG